MNEPKNPPQGSGVAEPLRTRPHHHRRPAERRDNRLRVKKGDTVEGQEKTRRKRRTFRRVDSPPCYLMRFPFFSRGRPLVLNRAHCGWYHRATVPTSEKQQVALKMSRMNHEE